MRFCVYGASSEKIDEIYLKKAQELGEEIAKRKIGLVFGGGKYGVMGATARGANSFGGEIIGVAPTFFEVDGVIYENCTEFIPTETMRQRKQIMEEKSDGFIVAPGGIGTYEEFFEILTAKQLSRHNKPIVIYNINGFYDDLIKFLESGIKLNFIKENCKELVKVFEDAKDAVDYIEAYDEAPHDVSRYKDIMSK